MAPYTAELIYTEEIQQFEMYIFCIRKLDKNVEDTNANFEI